MTTALIIGVIVVVAGAIAARARWSRVLDERHSVQVHQHTIETLRHMADRREAPRRAGSGPGGVTRRAVPAVPRTRPVTAPARPSSSPTSRPGTTARPPGVDPARLGAERARRHGAGRSPRDNGRAARSATARADAGGRRALVFVDDGAGPPQEVPPSVPLAVSAPDGRRTAAPWAAALRRIAETRPLLLGAAAAVVVAIVLVVALSAGSSPARRATDRPPSTRSHSHVTSSSPTTSVTAAAPAVVTPVSQTADAASYDAPRASYSVVLDATGLCWVLATDPATGQVVWTGTMAAGQTRTLATSGTMTVRLGAASDVSATVDGTQVELPAAFRSPFTMTFQPA